MVSLTAAGSGHGSANPSGPQNLTCIRGQSPLTSRISLSSDGPSRRERDRHTATPNGLALWSKERDEHVTPRAAHVGHGSRWVAPNPGLLSPCLGWGDLQTSAVTQGRLGGKGCGGRRQVLSLTRLKLNYMSRRVHFPCKQLKYRILFCILKHNAAISQLKGIQDISHLRLLQTWGGERPLPSHSQGDAGTGGVGTGCGLSPPPIVATGERPISAAQLPPDSPSLRVQPPAPGGCPGTSSSFLVFH